MNIKQVTVFGGTASSAARSCGRSPSRAIWSAWPAGASGSPNRSRRGRRRPDHLMRANLRMPNSVAVAVEGSEAVINAAGIPFQRGRQRYQRGPCRRRPRRSPRRRAPRACSGWSISRASAPTSRSSTQPLHPVQGRGRGRHHRRLRQRHDPAAERGVRPRRRACSTASPGSPRRRRSCRVVGNGSRQGPAGLRRATSARAAAAVLARPDTAKSVFELGGPRVYTYREIAALILREIDRDKPIIGVPAGLMKIAGFFAAVRRVGPCRRSPTTRSSC